jgi:pimeloyl-ACP methyl ester carboxylesterase
LPVSAADEEITLIRQLQQQQVKMRQIVFVHGMFQNPKSWENWIGFFEAKGYACIAPAWPLHEGEPAALRADPPADLGDLRLEQVLASVETTVRSLDRPVVIGHSVGGLITQILANRGLISAGIAIDSVAPNDMIDLDWGFIKNSAAITNPLRGNAPVYMDAKTFHAAFANSLGELASEQAYQAYATHDSRNVLRDCLGPLGHMDLSKPHPPLLLIGGEVDQIIPAHLSRKNAEAYEKDSGIIEFEEFAGRSHFICGEPGWEEVAAFAADWLEQHAARRGHAETGQGATR